MSGKVRKQWHDFQKKQSVLGSRGGRIAARQQVDLCVFTFKAIYSRENPTA
jgi:hypothetical protein